MSNPTKPTEPAPLDFNEEIRALDAVGARLRSHGIPARTQHGIFISLLGATRLADMLDDLKRAEEGGHV